MWYVCVMLIWSSGSCRKKAGPFWKGLFIYTCQDSGPRRNVTVEENFPLGCTVSVRAWLLCALASSGQSPFNVSRSIQARTGEKLCISPMVHVTRFEYQFHYQLSLKYDYFLHLSWYSFLLEKGVPIMQLALLGLFPISHVN